MAECVRVQCVPVGIASPTATIGYLCMAKIWAIGRSLGAGGSIGDGCCRGWRRQCQADGGVSCGGEGGRLSLMIK